MIPDPAPLPTQAPGGTPLRRIAFATAAVALTTIFLALGVWQVQRRAWKLDLIARIEQRVAAPPAGMPDASLWATVNAASDAYRRVRVTGRYLNDRETFVQATTELGAGFWLMTPLQQADGSAVLVNRGFVPPERRAAATRGGPAPEGETTVTGLLRITEPAGGFLRKNAPAENRWHSRDVQAIGAARGLARIAPFFIDAQAQAAPSPGAPWPVPGLTVVSFDNNHLVYAVTWFGLGLMAAAGGWLALRQR